MLRRPAGEPAPWQDLLGELRCEVWREPHLNEVIRGLRKGGLIDGSLYQRGYTPTANPLLSSRRKGLLF